jgi:hypothetical protein
MQTSSGSSGSSTENDGSGTDTEFLFKLGNYVAVLFFGGLTVTAVAETPEVLVLPLLASILFVPSVQDWVRSKGFEAVTPVKWVLAIISFVAVVGATPA